MSVKLIPNPKAPTDSTDYIYGERMEPYEERMNFFLNEKTKVNKDNVDPKDKDTVDGLESVIARFNDYGRITLPDFDESHVGGSIEGLEAMGRVRKVMAFLLQLAKDAVDFILNLINNRISRVSNREYNVSLDRKRKGLVSKPVKYPAGIKRLIDPINTSSDPNWVTMSLSQVNEFYKNSIKLYKELLKSIEQVGKDSHSPEILLSNTMDSVKRAFSMKNENDGLVSPILPGNRQLVVDDVKDLSSGNVGIYFQTASTPAVLRFQEWEPSPPVMDGVLNEVKILIKEIYSNQSTVSQLYRTFERAAKAIENSETKLTPESREYLNWIIRFNKRLMTVSIQYVLTSIDAGLDFAKTGIKP